MAGEVNDSLSLLAPADIQAVVVYLRSIPGRRSDDLPAPRSTPASDAPKLIQASFDPRGKQIFEGACASCHGWSGVSLLTSYATLTGDRPSTTPAP
jgi:cytochrome c